MNVITWPSYRRWLAIGLVTAILIVLDFFTGPLILFPVTFVLPVCLAGWYLGRWPALAVGLMCVMARLMMLFLWGNRVFGLTVGVINAVIQLFVLCGIGVLVDLVASQHRRLAKRLGTVERLLPICCFCKKIRTNEGTWEPIEEYLSSRSETSFSHGFCEACAKQHYPEVFRKSLNDS